MKNTFQNNINQSCLDKNQKLELNKSKEFISLFTQYVDTNKAQEKQGTKLGSISLYNKPSFTAEEQQKIVDYVKILEYCENYELDLSSQTNGSIDRNGDRIDNNGQMHEKLVNIAQFETNAINNLFDLGLDKIENKKAINKYLYNEDGTRQTNQSELQLIGYDSLINSYGPAFVLDIENQKKAIAEKQEEIEKIKAKKQSRNISNNEAISKIKTILN